MRRSRSATRRVDVELLGRVAPAPVNVVYNPQLVVPAKVRSSTWRRLC